MSGRKISGNTGDMVRAIAEGCVARAEAIRKKSRHNVEEDLIISVINDMTLNYFVGACACAVALGIPELEAHLKHVIITQIDLKGFVGAQQLAQKRPPGGLYDA